MSMGTTSSRVPNRTSVRALMPGSAASSAWSKVIAAGVARVHALVLRHHLRGTGVLGRALRDGVELAPAPLGVGGQAAGAFGAQPRRRLEHQLLDDIRVARCQPQRVPAAEGLGHHVAGAADDGAGEFRGQVGEVRHGADGRVLGRAVPPRRRRQVDRMPPRQDLDRRRYPRAAGGVQVQDRPAFAALEIGKPAAVQVDGVLGESGFGHGLVFCLRQKLPGVIPALVAGIHPTTRAGVR